jgi:hypothetical protein
LVTLCSCCDVGNSHHGTRRAAGASRLQPVLH